MLLRNMHCDEGKRLDTCEPILANTPNFGSDTFSSELAIVQVALTVATRFYLPEANCSQELPSTPSYVSPGCCLRAASRCDRDACPCHHTLFVEVGRHGLLPRVPSNVCFHDVAHDPAFCPCFF